MAMRSTTTWEKEGQGVSRVAQKCTPRSQALCRLRTHTSTVCSYSGSALSLDQLARMPAQLRERALDRPVAMRAVCAQGA